MDSNTENTKMVAIVAYLAALESFPLVGIAFVDVLIPLVAVQKGCSVDHHHRRGVVRK